MPQILLHQVALNGYKGQIEVDLSIKLSALRKQICDLIQVEENSIKIMLAPGKILNEEQTLQEQGVKENSKIMITKIKTAEVQPEAKPETKPLPIEVKAKEMDHIYSAAQTLAQREDGGDDDDEEYYFELRDQNGRIINLPQEYRKALVYAMTLHEKARKEIQRRNYDLALNLLEEADDNGFSKVPVEILETVDNYGYLCLDIAWVYMKLKDLKSLDTASHKLKVADACLKRTHGRDLERLLTIKDGSCPELVMYVRLYLLQGIVAFYSGDKATAHYKLNSALHQLMNLRVTEEEMAPLLHMGFTPDEIRIAMRSCNKEPDRAVMSIFEKREKKKQLDIEERNHFRERRLKRKYGKTVNGQYINLEILDLLVEQGFDKELVIEGLKQTDNDENRTVSLLLEAPNLLRRSFPAAEVQSFFSEDKINGLLQLGTTEEKAKSALFQTSGDIDAAAELILTGADLPEVPANVLESSGTLPQADLGTDVNEEEGEEEGAEEPQINEEEEARKAAEANIVNDIPDDEDSFLADTLDEEMAILQEYLPQVKI